jgi:hypothetical protein
MEAQHFEGNFGSVKRDSLVANVGPSLSKVADTVAPAPVVQPLFILDTELGDLRSRIHPSVEELRHGWEVPSI